MGCVELSNFHFCCAVIFCQPMKKSEFFGATRATRQRHSKTSSTGGEDLKIDIRKSFDKSISIDKLILNDIDFIGQSIKIDTRTRTPTKC